jgi:putative endonuclease
MVWIAELRERLERWRRPPLAQRGERAAERHLRRAGYRILARNLRCRLGEIDLLAEDRANRQIVIVEVKTSRAESPPPEVRVNHAKQRKLTALADHLVRRHRLQDRAVRFDVVAVVWPDGQRRPAEIRHHPAAFGAAW